MPGGAPMPGAPLKPPPMAAPIPVDGGGTAPGSGKPAAAALGLPPASCASDFLGALAAGAGARASLPEMLRLSRLMILDCLMVAHSSGAAAAAGSAAEPKPSSCGKKPPPLAAADAVVGEARSTPPRSWRSFAPAPKPEGAPPAPGMTLVGRASERRPSSAGVSRREACPLDGMLGGAAAGGGAPLEKGSFGGAPNGSAPEGAPNGSFGAGAPNPPPLEEAAKGSFIAGAPKGSAPPPPPRSPSKSGPAAVAPGRAPPPPTLAGMPSAGTAVDDSAFGLMTTAGNLPPPPPRGERKASPKDGSRCCCSLSKPKRTS
mmetsp:Transcript_27323/g.80060  ORF Transcript_27323/g.80060 Transcript_27323/m.80060 type:complete len:316 (-) Transcript_27323:580-1527(-)